MVEKYKLNLLVAFIILLTIIWLMRARMVWDWVGQLLLLGGAVLIVRTLLLREKKQATLLEFFLKTLIVSYIATAVIWFVWMGLILSLVLLSFPIAGIIAIIYIVLKKPRNEQLIVPQLSFNTNT